MELEFPASSESRCLRKQTTSSERGRGWGWGISDQPQGRRPEYLGHRADERKPLFGKRRAPSDKRSILLTARGVRYWSKERSDVAKNRAMGGQRGY